MNSSQASTIDNSKPTHTFEDNILINTAPDKVWRILTALEAVKRWNVGFGAGMHAEATWEKGTEVHWKIEDKTCAKGMVQVSDPNKELTVRFYDYDSNDDKAVLNAFGSYQEMFTLEEQDGKTLLKVKAGALNDKDWAVILPMWERTLPLIKQEAEN